VSLLTFNLFFSCINVKINFREKEKEVLDQILGPGRYDARIRPSGVNGTDGPAIVQVNLFVRSIATISDIKMAQQPTANSQLVMVVMVMVNDW
uniref:Glutamate-gated chloride channel-like n=1 Tax=Diabrotica virgifera virgifera TaxID=50390 RepID=A0A6P7G7R7_DIAVI